MRPKINVNELKAQIVRAGMSQKEFAEAIGLTASGLWRKMRGENSFTLDEIWLTKEVLGLSDEEARAIFLT